MPRIVDIKLIATQNLTQVFGQASTAASALSNNLKALGTSTASTFTAATGQVQKFTPAIKNAGSATKITADQMQDMGLALTTVGAGLAAAGAIAMRHERLVVSVQQAYKDAAGDMITFADTLAAETGNLFNDTDILAGERYFASLVNNYAVTAEQIQGLMRITADLAAGAGISFENASYRVTAAIRGEAEAAEYLGLTMNQQSIDRENLTLKMTNQEAAQFRINALYEQTSWAMGTASAVAQTSAGDWARLTNQFKDAAQAVGEFIGPYGALVAGLGTGAVGLAQFANGFTALASGIKIATVASIGFAASPIGLAVIAIGTAVAVGTKIWMDHRNEVKEAKAAYEDMLVSVEAMDTALRSLRMEDWGDAQWATNFTTKMNSEIDHQMKWLQDELMKSYGTGDWFDELVSAMVDPADLLGATADQAAYFWEVEAQKMIDKWIPDDGDKARFNDAMVSFFDLRGVVSDTTWDYMQNQFDSMMTQFDANTLPLDEVIRRMNLLIDMNAEVAQSYDPATRAANDFTAAQAEAQMMGLGSEFVATEEYQKLAQEASNATVNVEALAEVEKARAEHNKAAADEQAAWWDETRTIAEQEAAAAEDRAERRRRERAEFKEYALVSLAEKQREIMMNTRLAGAEEMRNKGLVASLGEVKQAYQDVAEARQEELAGMLVSATGMDDPLNQFNATSMASGASQLAANLRDAAASADSLFAVIVGVTDGLIGSADAIHSWAEELINVRGELGLIDELADKGLITGQSGVFDDGSQYAAAQDAYDSIADSTLRITDNLHAVQAIQAPLMASMLEAQADYTEQLLGMDAATQLVALGWMDAATASKAFEVQALAASAATGELGTNGVASVTAYIDSIVAAEPATAALLEQMGLIENVVRDSSGMIISYDVNLSGAAEAQSEIEALTESIYMLIDVLDDGALNQSYQITIDAEDNATPKVEQAEGAFDRYEGKKATGYVVGDNSDAMGVIDETVGAMNGLDGTTATVNIYANDLASGAIAAAHAAINALDGRTATTYVNTVRGVSYGPTEALGGVPSYAMGGSLGPQIVFKGAEGNRPEMLHYAMGGTAIIEREGYYAAPPMTYVSPHSANPELANGAGGWQVNFNGNFYGSNRAELNQWAKQDLIPAFKEEIRRLKGARS